MTRTALVLLVAGVLSLVAGFGLLLGGPAALMLLGVLLLVAGVGSLASDDDDKAKR